MNEDFFLALDLLEKEKGIPKEYMIEKVTKALGDSYKKEYGGSTNVRVVVDEERKELRMYQQMTVVEEITDPQTEILLSEAKKHSKRAKEGDVVEIEVKPKNFRRLSAQNGKQILIQGMREAERNMIIKEYESKREEIITARVTKIDPLTGNAVLDTGTSSATLLKGEQIPDEVFQVGDYVKVYVTEVRRELHGPIVTLSRKHPGLVKRLFELEIPEIADGTVIIKSIAREAGSRTKVAVYSRDENVEPVGACIGNRGSRINVITDELCGEKIDVVRFSEQPEVFVAEALSPAKTESVIMDGERSCRVTVAPDQLSLAIGKEGQNARLAARLTGYKIDIKPR